MNPRGEVDGLLLADGTQLRFPPHMGADLTRAIKPKASVTAQGEREAGRAFRAFTITDTASGTKLMEARPSGPPPAPPEERDRPLKPLQAEGKIKALLTAPRGETDGAVLDNGTIVRFRPDVAERLSWGLAFFEYCLQVPANRLGYGLLTAYQLKILQEAITLVVFVLFAWLFLGENLRSKYLVSFALMMAAVWVAFREG